MSNSNDTLNIEFGKKFTTSDFEFYIETYFSKCLEYNNVIFQLEDIEWIALEELTFFFGWIRYIKFNHPNLNKIKINLPSLHPIEDSDTYRRKKQRLLNLWNVWQIWKKCELDISFETNIKSEIHKYVDKYQNDSHWHHIVPFTKFDSKNILDFNDIRDKVERNVYQRFELSVKIESILEKHASLSPFENKALSGIITTELFLNSTIHAYNDDAEFKECYFAVALRNKINISDYKKNKRDQGIILSNEEVTSKIDYILKENLREKNEDEHSYFEDDRKKGISSNQSFIEFTFLDFGMGIPSKLKERYNQTNIETLPLSKKHKSKNRNNEFIISEDSRIIEFAFLLDASSNPFDKRLEINNYVPRGLFFLVDIIRRYKGLLVVRSGRGKVLYNFKSTSNIAEAVEFSKSDSNLPFYHGTLFSIYLPAKNEKELIFCRLEVNLEGKKLENKETTKSIIEYININEIYKLNKASLNGGGLTKLYNNTFKKLNEKIDSFENSICTIYIDFSGTEDIEIINRKLYFYLCNTPRFNTSTKVIIVHPSNLGELYQAKQAIKYSKLPVFRPIPCFIYDNKKKIKVTWLGITEDQDEELLNSCLLSKNNKTYNIDKYINRESLVGNVISINESDFVSINIENVTDILEHYSSKFIYEEIPRLFLNNYLSNKEAVSNQPKIIQEDNSYVYWTSGGYYQKKFITLIDLLYSHEAIMIGNRGETANERFGERVARYLIEKYNYKNDLPLDIDYIVTVTLSSQLLGKHIKDMYHRLIHNQQGNCKNPELIRLANYHEFTLEKAFVRIKNKRKVLIVNDVISTGRLSNDLHAKLIELKEADVVAIFTLIDSRVKTTSNVKHYSNEVVDSKSYKLIDFPIEKFKSKKELKQDAQKQVISIDPVINAPSMMKLERSMGNNILYFEKKKNGNKEFLDNFSISEQLWVGHFHHNVAHHSYYFKTHEILLSEKGEKLLKEIFGFISNEEFNENEINYVFHPMFSAIETLTNNKLKDILSEYPNFHIFPLPRIDTPKGWRFTFPPKLLNAKGWNFTKRNVLIIDDGSCSGDTLLQMIDSVAMIEVNKIVVVSIVARLEDFQREFFSRLSSIKGFKKYDEHKTNTNDTWESLSVRYNITVGELKKHNNKELKAGEIIGIPISEENYKDIPISIYFGAHFHIPVYSPLKHCPFCYETTELLDELNSNIAPPVSVKTYIENRIIAISIFETDGTPWNKSAKLHIGIPTYFPRNIDLKKLFLARDTIGKIDTYRLYRDYIKDSYDTIEIDYYLAIILHEKRLIDSISHLLPHLKMRLVNAIKKQVGLKCNDKNIQLTLHWNTSQLIEALFLLNEEVFLDKTQMKILTGVIGADDFDSINYLSYLYWKKLKTYHNKNTLIVIINEIWESLIEGKTKKAWGQFRLWILNQQMHPHSEGFSFQYLKDFYTRKEIEYPNHLTVGREFMSLRTKTKGLRFKVLEANLTVIPEDNFRDLKILFTEAITKLKHPFLEILNNKQFQGVINFCGYYDSFYSENISAKSILESITGSFNKPSSLKNINIIIERLDTFIDVYLNSDSNFAQFFIRHEININENFNKIRDEYISELNQNNINYSESINLESDILTRIHPSCFDIIISEFFKNCIKHSNEIKKLKKSNIVTNSISFSIKHSDDFVFLSYKHNLNIIKAQNLELNGLNIVKTVSEYFGGTFKISNYEHVFCVDISIPIVKRKYNF